MNTSRLATLAVALGVAGALLFAAGPAGIQLGVLSSFLGFRVFMLGALLGLIALVAGVAGLWQTRAAAQRTGRPSAAIGTALGAAILGIVFAAAGSSGGLPAINDITTNPDDPPTFRAAGHAEANRGRDLRYPGDDFARAQREAYVDLAPIRVRRPPAEVYRNAERAALDLGWQITDRDPQAGIIEAVDVTRIFRFVDDIVVRIRATDAGAVVDVRSKSRDGQGDMGANAARIRAFRDALAE